MTSFSEATAVTPSPSTNTTFAADVKRDWCIGVGKFPFRTNMLCSTLTETQFLMADI
jgi:hypothetical protein